MNIGWRQLVVVAAVAIVFGGAAGYLGGHYSGGAGDTQVVVPRYSPAPVQRQTESFRRFGDSDAERLERRLKCIEAKAQSAPQPGYFSRFLTAPC